MSEPNKITGARPSFHEDDVPEVLARLENIIRSGRLVFGDNTREFEESFRTYTHSQHAVTLNSCTTALEIVMRFFGVEGREVIVPTNTFAACVSAVIYAGGRPVLAEMDPKNFCLDIEDALGRINSRTAGVIIVHIAGLIHPEMDRLREACRERGLFLIEDASHAHGAAIDDRPAGSLADAACFSFYPTKVMTTGTGGMLTTGNSALADYARSVRHHGQGESLEQIINLGNDWCMNELGAALGIYQLKRLDENVAHRNQVVRWYREALNEISWMRIPACPENVRHAYYKFPVLVQDGVDRQKLRQIMSDEYHIDLPSIYDPPCHLQPVFQRELNCRAGMFPQAEETLRRQICLPMHAVISRNDVSRVVEALAEVSVRVQQ